MLVCIRMAKGYSNTPAKLHISTLVIVLQGVCCRVIHIKPKYPTEKTSDIRKKAREKYKLLVKSYLKSHRRVIQLCYELSRLKGCHAMWEWLINNHPVNTTISSLLQLNINGDKGIGLAILTQWNRWIVDELTCRLVISCVHPCTPIIQLDQPFKVNPVFLSWPSQ